MQPNSGLKPATWILITVLIHEASETTKFRFFFRKLMDDGCLYLESLDRQEEEI